MSACAREYPYRPWLGTIRDSRQVAHHASGPIGQSQLDRPVQILYDVTERTGNLQDDNVANDAPADTYLTGSF